MAGPRMTQTKAALAYCVSKLKPQDRFNIVPFSTEARIFAEQLQEANESNLARAQIYVEKLLPRGGTNINESLEIGLSFLEEGKLSIVVFLTDGLPTIGERNIENILKNVKNNNKAKASIFAFAVGDEINTVLLDKLAEEHNGTQEYVTDQEKIDVKISRFFDKLSSPVMTDVRLNFVGFHPTEIYPKKLPNLFKGSQLLITGRYQSSGTKAIQLIGTFNGQSSTLTDETNFHEKNQENDFVPRIWANRKVGYLMEEVRMHGVNEELKQEIIRLGKQYGIVTPYTSFLAVEESELAGLPSGFMNNLGRLGGGSVNEPARRRDLDQLRLQEEADFEGATSGASAVRQSKGMGKKKEAQSMEDALGILDDSKDLGEWNEGSDKNTQSLVKMVGDKTFIAIGSAWVDSVYKKDSFEVHKIVAFSKEYFDLIQKNQGIAKYLSVGVPLLIVFEGKCYQIVEK
jgi:Ca-activated chloride channel family protein